MTSDCDVARGHDDRGAEGESIDAPKASSGVGYEEGCLLPSPLGGLVWGSVVSSPSGVQGGAGGRCRIFCMF